MLKGLTAGFGMGPGVTPSLKSPRKQDKQIEVNQFKIYAGGLLRQTAARNDSYVSPELATNSVIQVCTANRIANQALDH